MDASEFRYEREIGIAPFLIIIPNQTAEFIFLFLNSPDLISRLLRDPVTVGVVSDAGQVDLSGANINEEKTVKVLSQMVSILKKSQASNCLRS